MLTEEQKTNAKAQPQLDLDEQAQPLQQSNVVDLSSFSREKDVERLEDTDLAYMTAALSELNKAKAVMKFVENQLSVKYQLGNGDEVTPAGEILRKSSVH